MTETPGRDPRPKPTDALSGASAFRLAKVASAAIEPLSQAFATLSNIGQISFAPGPDLSILPKY